MRILGIESSCDETGIAIYDDELGLLAHKLYSQVKVHADYGGVVPELASRDHVRKTIPLIDEAFKEAGCGPEDIDGVAYTAGPGLVGALLVGTSIGRSLAFAWDKPAVAVHHMEGHLLAPMLEDEQPEFPFVALLVSGGHTMMVKVAGIGEYEVLGESVDDAAGEAFDKTGKILGLKYPAGPEIDKRAQKGEVKFEFTEPNIEGLDFSFSGLKTSILYFLRDRLKEDPQFIDNELDNICASVQDRIVSILINKMRKAIEQTQIKDIAIAGGVSANSGLRNAFEALGKEMNCNVFIPAFQYCTDNAGMIAVAALYKFLEGDFVDLSITPNARMRV